MQYFVVYSALFLNMFMSNIYYNYSYHQSHIYTITSYVYNLIYKSKKERKKKKKLIREIFFRLFQINKIMFKNTIHVFCHPKPTLPNYFKGEKLFKIYMKQFIESEDE